MGNIKAIETIYNGFRFRSRLEARWAVFFDALDIEYQYEPEGFDLGEAGWYLPDFYLPQRGQWVEIKGNDVIPMDEAIKCQPFAKYCNENHEEFKILVGQVPLETIKIFNGKPVKDLGFIKAFRFAYECFDLPDNQGVEFPDWIKEGQPINVLWDLGEVIEKVDKALLKARQSRFEHGEKG
jgi:hypothetical protein